MKSGFNWTDHVVTNYWEAAQVVFAVSLAQKCGHFCWICCELYKIRQTPALVCLSVVLFVQSVLDPYSCIPWVLGVAVVCRVLWCACFHPRPSSLRIRHISPRKVRFQQTVWLSNLCVVVAGYCKVESSKYIRLFEQVCLTRSGKDICTQQNVARIHTTVLLWNFHVTQV